MRPLALWVCFCAYLNLAGWALSAIHQLNAGGYAAALALALVAAFIWVKKSGGLDLPKASKLARRFRRGFPLAFLVLTAMAFLGGILYAPSNYDALAYRVPRVLHWLSVGHWEWVHTIFDRINNRSCGVEWVSAPVIAIFHSLRPLFLINFISFLFLPGLVFSLFTRLGVRSRVAWHWMWLMPTAYCLLLQVGSIGNDLFGVLFVLAAIDSALRARATGDFSALLVSVVSAGMMTAAKTNNLPMLLPWAVAMLPCLKFLVRRPVATSLVCLLAMVASGLPTFYFNYRANGDWSGARLNNRGVNHAVACRTAANAVTLPMQNLVPPLFPMADRVNQTMKTHLPPDLHEKLAMLGEAEDTWFQVPQMQTEESAGFGFGLSVLLGASFLAMLGRKTNRHPMVFSWPLAIRVASVAALAAVLTQANVAAVGRLFSSYYFLPCTMILAMSGQEKIVRRCWWRMLAWLVFLMSAMLLVVSPARPLFPRDLLLEKIHEHEPAHPILARVDTVYSVYRDRPTAFAPALAELPPGTTVLGYAAFDKPETSLWLPLGSRRIVHFGPADGADFLKRQGVRYALVLQDEFQPWFGCPLSDWCQRMNATVVKEIPLRVRASKETPQTWCLIELH